MSEGKVSFLGAPPSRPWLQAPVRPSPSIPLRFHLPCKPLSHHPDPLFQWMTSPPTDKMKMTGCKFHHFKMYHHLNSALTVLLVLEEELSWLPPRPIHSLQPIPHPHRHLAPSIVHLSYVSTSLFPGPFFISTNLAQAL